MVQINDKKLKSELLVAQGLRCRPFVAGDGSAGDRRSDRVLLPLFMLIEGDEERSWRLYSGHVMETDSALN